MTTGASTAKTDKYLRIATEEAFAPAEMIRMYRDTVARNPPEEPGFMCLWGYFLQSTNDYPVNVVERLQDLGERRLHDMDSSGIDVQVIFLTAPGVQIFDTATAVALAGSANDQLAEACRRHPER